MSIAASSCSSSFSFFAIFSVSRANASISSTSSSFTSRIGPAEPDADEDAMLAADPAADEVAAAEEVEPGEDRLEALGVLRPKRLDRLAERVGIGRQPADRLPGVAQLPEALFLRLIIHAMSFLPV